jgi:hypothetical protein
MNCNRCKHREYTLCKNPKNFQPRFRQYNRVKQLSKVNFPIPPVWCKGFEPMFTIILQGSDFSVPCPSDPPHWEIL